VKELKVRKSMRLIIVAVTLPLIFNLFFITVNANKNGKELEIKDDFNDDRIDKSLWNIVFGSWIEENHLIHSEDYWLLNPKYLKLKENLSNYSKYEISLDIVPTPIDYNNEYTDGGVIFGQNINKGYGIYLDTVDKSLVLYERDNLWEENYLIDKTIDEMKKDGSYRLKLELNKNKKDKYDLELKVIDLSDNNVIYWQIKENLDLHFNDLFLYSTWGRWSSFDNFQLKADREDASVYPPADFTVIQEGDELKLTWKIDDSKVTGFEIFYSDDGSIDEEDIIRVVNKHERSYNIDVSDEMIESENIILGIRSKKGNDRSKIVTDSIFLMEKPKEFKYINYGDFVEFRWEHVEGAVKYILYDENGNPLTDENGNVIETLENKINYKSMRENLDFSKFTVVAYNVNNGYSPPSDYPEEIVLERVENFEVVQEGSLYSLQWNSLPLSLGYELYSGITEESMVKLNQDLIIGTSYQYNISEDDYDSTRYFKIRAKLIPETDIEYSGYSEVIGFRPIKKPEIIQSPGDYEAESGETLIYQIKVYKSDLPADLIIEAGDNLELTNVYYNDTQLQFTTEGHKYKIDLSRIDTEVLEVQLEIKAVNMTEDNINTSFKIYTVGYKDSGDKFVYRTATVSSNITIEALEDVGNIELGLIDREDQSFITDSEQSIFYGEELGLKSIFNFNSGNIYNPIIKFTLGYNQLFKFKFPEPVIVDETGNGLNYSAVYIKNDDSLVILIKPALSDDRFLKNTDYEVKLLTNVIPISKDEIRDIADSKGKPLWKIPYIIRDIIEDEDKLSLNIKMQLLWNATPKMTNANDRDRSSQIREIKLKLENMDELPGAF